MFNIKWPVEEGNCHAPSLSNNLHCVERATGSRFNRVPALLSARRRVPGPSFPSTRATSDEYSTCTSVRYRRTWGSFPPEVSCRERMERKEVPGRWNRAMYPVEPFSATTSVAVDTALSCWRGERDWGVRQSTGGGG